MNVLETILETPELEAMFRDTELRIQIPRPTYTPGFDDVPIPDLVPGFWLVGTPASLKEQMDQLVHLLGFTQWWVDHGMFWVEYAINYRGRTYKMRVFGYVMIEAVDLQDLIKTDKKFVEITSKVILDILRNRQNVQ